MPLLRARRDDPPQVTPDAAAPDASAAPRTASRLAALTDPALLRSAPVTTGLLTVTAIVAALLVVATAAAGGALVSPVTPVDVVLVMAGCLAVVACRRRAPALGVALVAAAMLAFVLRGHVLPSAAFPVFPAVFFAVRAGRLLVPVVAVGAFMAAFLGTSAETVSGIGQNPLTGLSSLQAVMERSMLLVGWFVASGVAGAVSRHRRAYLAQVEERAAEAERTREETAQRRAVQERLRIARELHDSLTHSISIVKVQAGIAIHLARKRGEQVPDSLLAIQQAGSDAMRELRATLEVLRGPADETPGSGLDRLEELLERARSTGLVTSLKVGGRRRELSPAVDAAAYRIVQEALTNVTRHADAGGATVLIDYRPAELVVEVEDDGCGRVAEPPVPGVGLIGMRERVTGLGGRLETGPRAEGGFRVRAELPAPPEAP